MTNRWLVVGLGNPGPTYAGNRHNVGKMVLGELAVRRGATFRAHKTRAAVAEARLGVLPGGAPGPPLVLASPETFMNVSGGPVANLARFYGVEPGQVVVIHDELDIPFDSVRLKLGGGDGGHNGLRDITKALGTNEYLRVRVGIGRPPGRQDPAKFVLSDFSPTERKQLPFLLADGADAVEELILSGLTAAQQRFHAPQ